jgi:hypothetical protein
MDRNFTPYNHINHISKIYGSDRTEPTYCNADRMFRGYPYVQTIAHMQCKYSTSSLMKNDLNGHFLTDQPGQPFDRGTLEHAGIGVLPPDKLHGFFSRRPARRKDSYSIKNIKHTILLLIKTRTYHEKNLHSFRNAQQHPS